MSTPESPSFNFLCWAFLGKYRWKGDPGSGSRKPCFSRFHLAGNHVSIPFIRFMKFCCRDTHSLTPNGSALLVRTLNSSLHLFIANLISIYFDHPLPSALFFSFSRSVPSLMFIALPIYLCKAIIIPLSFHFPKIN